MIGRVQEVKELKRLYSRNKAELVAVYGRRRVGKTYFIDEIFINRITFRHAGLSPANENSKIVKSSDPFAVSLIRFGSF